MRRIEQVIGFEGYQEAVDRLGLRQFKGHVGVRKDVAIVTEHDRDVHPFGQIKGLNNAVDDLLMVARVDLNPAGVALRDGILLVVPDIPGRAHGPVHHAHDQRQSRTRGPLHLLVHVEQAVGAGGGKGPGPGRTGGHADRQGRMLALDRDVFGAHLAGVDHLGKLLGERRLRGNGIGRNRRSPAPA